MGFWRFVVAIGLLSGMIVAIALPDVPLPRLRVPLAYAVAGFFACALVIFLGVTG